MDGSGDSIFAARELLTDVILSEATAGPQGAKSKACPERSRREPAVPQQATGSLASPIRCHSERSDHRERSRKLALSAAEGNLRFLNKLQVLWPAPSDVNPHPLTDVILSEATTGSEVEEPAVPQQATGSLASPLRCQSPLSLTPTNYKPFPLQLNFPDLLF
jgi:hypothetical protein